MGSQKLTWFRVAQLGGRKSEDTVGSGLKDHSWFFLMEPDGFGRTMKERRDQLADAVTQAKEVGASQEAGLHGAG